MLWLALRTLRHRKGSFAATFVCLFVGAAVVMACGGLMETGVHDTTPPQRLAGAPIVVAGGQTFALPSTGHGEDSDHETAVLPERVRLDAATAAALAAVPGVDRVVPDLSFPAELPGANAPPLPGTQVGHAWDAAALTPFRLVAGTAPDARGAVVVDAGIAARLGLRPGDPLPVVVAGERRDATVSGIVATDHPVATESVFFSGADAAAYTATPGAVDAFGVLPAPGADTAALRTALDRVVGPQGGVTLVGDDRGRAEFSQAANDGELLVILAGVFGGLAVQIVMFVVASTFALSVQQRRREIAMMRAVGTSPAQLSRMITGEAMVIGAVATVLAIPAGAVLGAWLEARLVDVGIVAPVVAYQQTWLSAAAAIVTGLLTVWGAAFVAARYAARTHPVEAMREATAPGSWLTPMRIWIGVSCLAGAAVLAFLTVTVMTGPLASSTAGPAVMLVAMAVALMAPGATKALISVLRVPLQAVSGLPGYLAAANARARWLPMAGAVTPIMLASALAIFMLYFQTTQTAAAEKEAGASVVADAVVSSPTGALDTDLLSRVRRVPGVGTAGEYVTSRGYTISPADPTQDEDGVTLAGVDAGGLPSAWRDRVASGSLDDLSGQAVALPADLARRIGVRAGDPLTMRLGDGARADLTVVATLRPAPGEGSAGEATALMPVSTLAPHTTVGSATEILVTAAPGADAAQLSDALTAVTADRPAVQVEDRAELVDAQLAAGQVNAWVNYLIVGLLLVYASISLVNTLVMATTHRRREFSLARLTGVTRGQVMSMMTVEAVMVAVIGCVLGTVVAASMLLPFSAAVSGSVLPSGPIWIFLAVVALSVLLTVVATWVPTWLCVRGRPEVVGPSE